MANVDRPIGLRPLRHLGGGEVRMNGYTIASGYNVSLGAGDPVIMTGTGRNIAVAAASEDGCIGVFYGVRYTNAAGERKYSADLSYDGGIRLAEGRYRKACIDQGGAGGWQRVHITAALAILRFDRLVQRRPLDE
jgi:hypothetical protein